MLKERYTLQCWLVANACSNGVRKYSETFFLHMHRWN